MIPIDGQSETILISMLPSLAGLHGTSMNTLYAAHPLLPTAYHCYNHWEPLLEHWYSKTIGKSWGFGYGSGIFISMAD